MENRTVNLAVAGEHTRGPWLISRHGTPEYAPQFGIYSASCPHDFVIVKSSTADAELITRAPELMAENRQLREALEDCINQPGCLAMLNPKKYGQKRLQAITGIARAALKVTP